MRTLTGVLLVLGLILPASAAARGPGSLDLSFGDRGTVLTQLGPEAQVNDLAVAPDGSIVIGGTARDPAGQATFLLARYRADGAPDETFGVAGVVRAQLGRGEAPASSVRALALEPDGDVVAVGSASGGEEGRLAAARFDRSGRLEWSVTHQLGVASALTPRAFSDVDAVVRQPDGALVLAGGASAESGLEELAIARLSGTDGSLDPSFAGRGYVIEPQPRSGLASASFISVTSVTLASSGSIVVGGGVPVPRTPNYTPILARYSPTGERQSGYPTSRSPLTFISALATRRDGTLLAAGARRAAEGVFEEPAFARLTAAAEADTGFGDRDGSAPAPGTGRDGEILSGLAEQPDGRILSVRRNRVVRALADGSPDDSFGVDAVSADTRLAPAGLVGLQPDGAIVVAGSPRGGDGTSGGPAGGRIGLVRLLGGTAPGRIAVGSRATVRRGVARLSLRCRAPRGASGCKGTVRLTSLGGGRRTLARAGFDLSPDARRDVRIPLDRGTRQRLRKGGGRLRLRAAAVSPSRTSTQRRILLVGR